MRLTRKRRYGLLALALVSALLTSPVYAADEYKGLADEQALSSYMGSFIEISASDVGKDGMITKDGKPYTGRVIERRPDNQVVQAVYEVVDGKREGFYHLYYPTGRTDLSMIYQNGQVVQETGYFPDGEHVQYAYKINGDRGTVTQYADINGKLDMVTEFRFENVKDPRSRLIRDGKQTQYSPDGKIHSEIHYKNDLADGNVTIYYPTGELKIKGNASNGQYEGAVTVYYPSGAVKETIEKLSGPVENGGTGYTLNGKYRHFSENGILSDERQLSNFHVSAHPTQAEIEQLTTKPTTTSTTSGTPTSTTTTTDANGNVTVINNYEDDDDNDAAGALIVGGTALVIGAAIYDDNYYDYWDDWDDWHGWGPPPPPPPRPPGPPGPPGPAPTPPKPTPVDPTPRLGQDGGGVQRHPDVQPGSGGTGTQRPGAGSGTQHATPSPGAGGSGTHTVDKPGAGGGTQHTAPHPGSSGGGVQKPKPAVQRPQAQARPHPHPSGGFQRGGFRRR